MAERCGHGMHDELVSPKKVPMARAKERIEVEVHGAVRDGEPRRKQEGEDKALKVLHVTQDEGVEEIEQRVVDEDGVADQHPDKGLISGSSKDGLGHEEATEEDGRSEEGEEGRAPRMIPVPIYVSKAEREEHELTHTPYRSWCDHCVRCRGRNTQHRKAGKEERKVTCQEWHLITSS